MTGTEARLQDPQNTGPSALGDSDLTESLVAPVAPVKAK